MTKTNHLNKSQLINQITTNDELDKSKQ